MTIKVEINMNNFPIKDRVTVYEARTRLGGCRTGVRRGPMRGAASDMAAHSSMPRLSFFFFFFFHIFVPTQLDSWRLGFDSRWFGQNQTVLAESGRIDWRPKQAEISLKPSLFLTPKTLHKQNPSIFAHHNHQNQNQLSITTLPLKTRNGLVPKPKASLSSVQSNPSSPISTKKSDSPIIVIDNYDSFTYNLCQVCPQFFCFYLFFFFCCLVKFW